MKDYDIENQTSTLYKPQQNGVVERANRTIVEIERNMFHIQNLYKSFRAEVAANAVHTQNRYPTRALDSITPNEVWSGKWLCIAHIRVFGYFAYAVVLDVKNA